MAATAVLTRLLGGFPTVLKRMQLFHNLEGVRMKELAPVLVWAGREFTPGTNTLTRKSLYVWEWRDEQGQIDDSVLMSVWERPGTYSLEFARMDAQPFGWTLILDGKTFRLFEEPDTRLGYWSTLISR